LAHVLPYPGPNAWQANSAYIARYQAALIALGFLPAGSADGKFGPATKAAVLAYQNAQPGLTKDGEAGPDTAAALESSLANAGAFGPAS
jgi:peptidoglycan hydrolase-like protein with peptidoglycan-binding domain